MKLHIKNMVSDRCKMKVREELNKFGFHFIIVGLGEVDVMEDISAAQREQLKINLHESGLELIDDNHSILVEHIKTIIVEMVWNATEVLKTNFSDFLSDELGHDYTYLSNLFSEVQGVSIQQFIILHKIERIKELLSYDELNLTEISKKLHYSSVAHLSNQFKKITGFSPIHFRELKEQSRTPIEEIGIQKASTQIKYENKSTLLKKKYQPILPISFNSPKSFNNSSRKTSPEVGTADSENLLSTICK